MSPFDPSRFVAEALQTGQQRRGILFHGPNEELVTRLKTQSVEAFRSSIDDVYVSTVTEGDIAANPGAILEQLQSVSLFGSYNLIIVDALSKSLHTPVIDAASASWSAAALIVTAGSLSKSAPLRKTFEKAAHLSAVPCYEQSREELAAHVQGLFHARNLTATNDAIDALLSKVDHNPQLILPEVEKLSLYRLDSSKPVSVEDVEAIAANSPGSSMDALCDSTFSGHRTVVLRLFTSLENDGIGAAGVLAALSSHCSMLLELSAECEKGGLTAVQAVKARKPPIFWKRHQSIASQVSGLHMQGLKKAMEELQLSTMRSRRTPALVREITERLLMALSSNVSQYSRLR